MRKHKGNKSRNNIVSSAIVVTILTFVIKALGLVKQSVIAAFCGATYETDAFFIATGILVSLCTVIFSAISVSLLTIHTNTLIKEGREKSNQLINAVLRFFIPIALIISILFFIGAPIAAKIFAPTYMGYQLDVLIHYIRIMSCSFVLWCYYLIINVVLETEKRFLPGRGQALFQNVFLIIGAVLLYKEHGISILVYGFLLSGLAECVLVTWCARKEFCLLFQKITINQEINQLLKLSIPLIIGSAIYEVNDIVDKQISTGLGIGNVSYLTYGGTVNEIVTGVVVASISKVLFAHFATWIAQGEVNKVGVHLKRVLEYLTLIILPIMVMCIVAGDQIVSILYGRGSFGSQEIQSTYGVVIGYSVGFIFQAARANIVRVYYAFQDTKRPMINGGISVGINILLSLLFSKYLGATGVALATSVAMLVATILLLKDINKYIPEFRLNSIVVEAGKGCGAAAISAILLIIMRKIMIINLYISFFIEGCIVVLVYLILLIVFKSNCANNLVNRIKQFR